MTQNFAMVGTKGIILHTQEALKGQGIQYLGKCEVVRKGWNRYRMTQKAFESFSASHKITWME